MPNIIDIQEFEESFVIYLGSDSNSVSAYTLASTLISFADAAKVANDFINPGYNIEIQVIALEDGSFKAKIKAVFEDAKNLFSKETLKIVVLAVIAAYIYDHTLAPDKNVNVIVSDDLVKIEQGDKIIVVPKEVHNYLNQIKESEKFQREIGNVFSTLEKDRTINSFGIQKNIKDSEPPAVIPRSKFSELSALASETINEEERAITQVVQLQIIRAILEKGSRKWQFSWKGIRISALFLMINSTKNFTIIELKSHQAIH